MAWKLQLVFVEFGNRKKKGTLYLPLFFSRSISAQEQNFGDRSLHVFLQDGSPVARLGCGGSHVLNAAAEKIINDNRWTTIKVRYVIPFRSAP